MKTLTKLFFAVAALFAFACTTDATEDLNIKIGDPTTLTISLEQTKTQLGEKVDGVYPLYWSEGDQIAINGVASNKLSAEDAGTTSATFNFEKTISYPYNIVYPAPITTLDLILDLVGSRATEEAQRVTFLAEQPYKVGSFAEGAAPMYAQVASAEEAITMKHLAGALRFAVKGEATLSSLAIEAESGNLAGTYTVDCTTGALTLVEGSASNKVSLSFGEGLALSATATPIYVAVPAGEYGEVVATLTTTSGEQMVVKFNTAEKPIAAGKVREFTEFEFAANVEDSDAFVIDSKEALIRFASAPTQSAVVTAAIDMTGEAWTPIEGFAATFDGGNFEIKGLSAPLFGTVSGEIKNVKLTGVAITETERVRVGSIACEFIGKMTNCEAAGALEMNNTTFTTDEPMKNYDIINVGGLVGHAGTVTFTNCVNRVNVTIKSIAASTQAGVYCGIGGAIGGAHSQTSITNVDNYGSVTVDGVINSTTDVGGILGRMIEYKTLSPDIAILKDCDNYGVISTSKNAKTGQVVIGGISARLAGGVTDFSNNHNHESGAISHNGKATGIYIAGIVGYKVWSKASNCSNAATVTCTGSGDRICIGGITAYDPSSPIENCSNSGTLSNSGTSSDKISIGGIAAADKTYNAKSTLTGCTNSGEIISTGKGKALHIGGIITGTVNSNIENCTNSGDITHTGASTGGIYVSGIISYQTNASVLSCTNTGSITVGGTTTINCGLCYITGIVGEIRNGRIYNCKNGSAEGRTAGKKEGFITVKNLKGTGANDFVASGIVAKSYVTASTVAADKWSKNYNYGDLSIANFNYASTSTSNKTFFVAGLSGNVGKEGDVTEENLTEWYQCANYGNITVDGMTTTKTSWRTLLSGCFGSIACFDVNDCHNYGAIDVKNGASGRDIIVGGLISYYSTTLAGHTMYIKDSSNEANVSVSTSDPDGTNGKSGFYVGGVVGQSYMSNATADHPVAVTNVYNTGDISVGGTGWSEGYNNGIGGLAGDWYTYGTFTDCYNTGDVKMETTSSFQKMNLGGLMSMIHPKNNLGKLCVLVNCYNTGNVTAKSLTATTYLRMGGLVGWTYKQNNGIYEYDGCWNEGKVLADGVTTTAELSVGGITGYVDPTTITFKGVNTNVGDIEVVNSTVVDASTWIGGIVGNTVIPVTGAQCFCDIMVSELTNVGWIMGTHRTSAITATNCAIGGHAQEWDEEQEQYKKIPITDSNFLEYIYGSGKQTDWTGTNNNDGCSVLTEKPKVE